jgi:hypothetical protein
MWRQLAVLAGVIALASGYALADLDKKDSTLVVGGTTTQGQFNAVLLARTQAVARQNDSLRVELGELSRRMAKLERAWGARDSTGTKPRRPRLDKPPDRPELDRRPRP